MAQRMVMTMARARRVDAEVCIVPSPVVGYPQVTDHRGHVEGDENTGDDAWDFTGTASP